jgi:hypothetical protein
MPKVSNDKLARLKAAAHRGLAHAHTGIKSTGLPLAAGAASSAIMDKAFDSLPDLIKSNWWGRGAAIAVAGHFIGVKKNRRAGDALLGAAGAQLYNDYQKNSKKSDITKGADDFDAGALVDRMTTAVNQLNQAIAPIAGAMQAGAIMGGGAGMGYGGDTADVGIEDAGDSDDAGDWGDSF